MDTTPLDDDEVLVAWALATGPDRGLIPTQIAGRVALAPARISGAARRLVERGAVRVTPASYHRLTPAGQLLVGAAVAGEADQVRDAGAVGVLVASVATYAEVAEVVGLAAPSAAHGRYADAVKAEQARTAPT